MNYQDAILKPNAKGQIVIPKIMRETLHIDQKTYLRLKMQGSIIYVEPIKKFVGATEPRETLAQVLKKVQGSWGPATKEEIAWEKKRRVKELARSRRMKAIEW